MYFGLIGAFLFILIQLVLLVDFAHSWNSAWVERMEDTGSKVWAGLLLFFTFLMYGVAVAGIVCLYIYFTHGKEDAPEKACHTNKFFISFNLILCVIASALAIHPKVQERQPRSGRCCKHRRFSTKYGNVYINPPHESFESVVVKWLAGWTSDPKVSGLRTSICFHVIS